MQFNLMLGASSYFIKVTQYYGTVTEVRNAILPVWVRGVETASSCRR